MGYPNTISKARSSRIDAFAINGAAKRASLRCTRFFIKLALLLGLLFQAFIPAGAMLKTDGQGKTTISVCTDQGLITAWIDPQTGELHRSTPSEDGGDKKQHCAYAAMLTFFATNSSPVVQYVIAIAQPYRPAFHAMTSFIGQSPLRLSARGPPQSV